MVSENCVTENSLEIENVAPSGNPKQSDLATHFCCQCCAMASWRWKAQPTTDRRPGTAGTYFGYIANTRRSTH